MSLSNASNDWMTLEQLADFLQLKPKAIYDMTHRRKIPFTKIGRRLRFNRHDIERWLNKNRCEELNIPVPKI